MAEGFVFFAAVLAQGFLCACLLYTSGFYFRRCNRAVCLFTECIGDVTGTHGIDRISCIRNMDYENYRGIAASKE